MTNRFCPLLSAKLLNGSPEDRLKNIAKLRFPLMASGKYDGWRIFEYNGEATTRSLKTTEPKNVHTRKVMRELYAAMRDRTGLRGGDGELIAGANHAANAMQSTTSGIGSYEGKPELTYNMFDTYQFAEKPFTDRLKYLEDMVSPLQADFPWVKLVRHVWIHNVEQMWDYMREQMALGLEGIMLRDPNGRYKMGRSSLNEGILIAVKKWETAEGRIKEVREQMYNANEARTNALGHTERSSHKDNLHGKDTMGSVLVESAEFTEDFSVGNGPGLDAGLRKHIWENQHLYVGKMLTFRYQAEGVKTRPRFPQWMSIRDEGDRG
jgi:DNA ligase-1